MLLCYFQSCTQDLFSCVKCIFMIQFFFNSSSFLVPMIWILLYESLDIIAISMNCWSSQQSYSCFVDGIIPFYFFKNIDSFYEHFLCVQRNVPTLYLHFATHSTHITYRAIQKAIFKIITIKGLCKKKTFLNKFFSQFIIWSNMGDETSYNFIRKK